MTDLKFSDLASAAPANAVVVSNGTTALLAGVYINTSALTGDTHSALTSTGVVETVIKLLKAGNVAQTAANAVVGATQINSFPSLSYGTPTISELGAVSSVITGSVIGQAPLDGNAITANV